MCRANKFKKSGRTSVLRKLSVLVATFVFLVSCGAKNNQTSLKTKKNIKTTNKSKQQNTKGKWILIQPGSFVMGSKPGEAGRKSFEGPAHKVKITKAFYIMKTEVTQGEWQDLMGNNPSFFKDCGSNCPVEQVNWYDALVFANQKSKTEGLRSCYKLSACKNQPGQDFFCSNVRFVYNCNGYRLPTEAEWEFVAKANKEASTLKDFAWFHENSTANYKNAYKCAPLAAKTKSRSCGTQPVASKKANSLGVFDLSGNVWEWVYDTKREYSESSQTNPKGSYGKNRVIKGCGWANSRLHCRVSARGFENPKNTFDHLGFRLAKSATQN